MIRYSDVQKAVRIAQSQGLVTLLQKLPHHFHWRAVKQLEPVFKWNFERQHGSGLDVMAEDWDNLVLLDACRYDYFKKYTSFDGELSRVVSKGRGSWEFIRENYLGRQFHETVYLTANPRGERLDQDVFFTVETLHDRWDESLGTVPPASVTEAALEAQERYPNKRLIIHYMQPHVPHLGQTAEKFRAKHRDIESAQTPAMDGDEIRNNSKLMFDLYNEGEITKPELRQSYIETLEVVESHVNDLVDELTGKTVISADHGENLGERRYGMSLTGHGPQSKEIRFVPWMELPYKERKTIIEDSPIGFHCIEEDIVEQRLRDLGYR